MGVYVIMFDLLIQLLLFCFKDGVLNFDILFLLFKLGCFDLNDCDFEVDVMIFCDIGVDVFYYYGESGLKLWFVFDNFLDLGIWKKLGVLYICIELWYGIDVIYGSLC